MLLNGISYLKIDGDINSENILIFLPGLGAYKENYIFHLNSFIPLYKTIYSVDLPEQGSKGEWTIGNMVNNLKEFINTVDNFEINNIHLAGHSAGALSILSFLFNYNSNIESILLTINNDKNYYKVLNDELKNLGFAQPIPESKKVKKLILYSPPDSFNIVLPKKISNILKNKNNQFLKRTLNNIVNRPMIFLNYFQENQYFNFRLEKSNKLQYFNLVLKNHNRFFDYIERYDSIFEIQEKLDSTFRIKISDILKNKNILIQYGSNDWLLKPFYKRKITLDNNFKFGHNIYIKKHNYLGHLLSKKMNLDINLNRQMITNKVVIRESKNFIIN